MWVVGDQMPFSTVLIDTLICGVKKKLKESSFQQNVFWMAISNLHITFATNFLLIFLILGKSVAT